MNKIETKVRSIAINLKNILTDNEQEYIEEYGRGPAQYIDNAIDLLCLSPSEKDKISTDFVFKLYKELHYIPKQVLTLLDIEHYFNYEKENILDGCSEYENWQEFLDDFWTAVSHDIIRIQLK